MEHRPPPPRDTQLPFDMLFITMFYTCHVKEVVYHRGEQIRIRKSLKLYIVYIDLIHIYSPDTNKYDVFSTQ